MSRPIQVRNPRRRSVVPSVLMAALVLTSACGPTPNKSGGGGKAASATGSTTVHVKNFSFDPQKLSVTKGTKVTWKFEDSSDHTVTASDKSFKSGNLKSGGTYSFTFTKPGVYQYICSIHQYMTGSVTVK